MTPLKGLMRHAALFAAAALALSLSAADKAPGPVSPRASAEARALLKLVHDLSGRYTLTGQHNYPNTKDRNTRFAAGYVGKTPAVFSTDWGFAEAGDTDSYLARPDIVEEATRQHRLGSLVTICWHAVPPTADEPVTFRPGPGGAAPESLASVQGRLLDGQFKDVLTPGTRLHARWCAQVDSVAFYLKKLEAARVPVLWRPYHEMNGDWFWWGGRHGESGTAALYRALFDRFTKIHRLDNLVWVWSMDRPNKPEMFFSHYFPGTRYVDVLSLDVYGADFNAAYYDSLVALSGGKPVALAEVGNPPPLEILSAQPKWAFYVIWAGMVRNTPRRQHRILTGDPRVLSLEDAAYREVTAPFRAACGLYPLPPSAAAPSRPDFSGRWVLNEDRCVLDDMGTGSLPSRLEITQAGNDFEIRRTLVVEYADDRVTEEKLTLDGTEVRSEFRNSPRFLKAGWSESGDTLLMESRVVFNRGDRTSEMKTIEFWSLGEQGRILSIRQVSDSYRGKRDINMVFDRIHEPNKFED